MPAPVRLVRLLLLLGGCGRINFDDAGGVLGDAIDAPQPIVGGPEAWWRFEEAPSAGLRDWSGNGHTGLCTTCPSLVPGHDGSAYDFSSGSPFVYVPDDGAFRDDVALTVAGWALFRDGGFDSAAISKPYQMNDENSWQFQTSPTNLVCVTDNFSMDCTPGALVIGTWQHFAFTIGAGTKRLYIDGTPRGQWPTIPIPLDMHDVVLGADYRLDASGGFSSINAGMNGQLDEVLIYDRVLADQEIAMLAGL